MRGRSLAAHLASSNVAGPVNVAYSTPGQLYGHAHGHRQWRAGEPASDPSDNGRRLLTLGDDDVRNRGTRSKRRPTPRPVTPLSGFTGTVTFSITGLPSGATPPSAHRRLSVRIDSRDSVDLRINTSGNVPTDNSRHERRGHPHGWRYARRDPGGRLHHLGLSRQRDRPEREQRHLHRSDRGAVWIQRHGIAVHRCPSEVCHRELQPPVGHAVGNVGADADDPEANEDRERRR